MDSLTQAVLGAATYSAVMGKHQRRKALWIGAALGTLPDLDILVRYADPISHMTNHRGATHSLFLLTALAWLLAWLWYRKKRGDYSLRRLLFAIWLALITHPLIDAMTMYGTQLWYPFMPPPTSWATVFVIDPLYTLPLLIACVYYYMKPPATKALWLGIAWGCAYFGWGFYSKMHHEAFARDYLENQGITIKRMISNPSPFNTIVWRILAEDHHGNAHELYRGWLDQNPPEMRTIALNRHLINDIRPESPLLQRLIWFTDDWLMYQQHGNELVVTDIRMGYGNETAGFRYVIAENNQAITPKRFGTRTLPEDMWSKLWLRIQGKGSALE